MTASVKNASPASDTFVSVVAVIQNDALILEEFATQTLAVLKEHYENYELILVDNGSQDHLLEKVDQLLKQENGIRVMELSRAFGKDAAIDAGLVSSIGDFIVVMMPETDPPAMIPEMVQKSREGSDIVVGIPRADEPPKRLYRLGAKLLHAYFHRVLKIDLHPGSSDFRVLSRRAANAITSIRDRRRHLRHFVATIGYRSTTVDYDPVPRKSPKAPPALLDHINQAIDLIVASSSHPLRVVSLLGLLASGVNLLYLVYVLIVYAVYPGVAEGWTSISFVQGVMFFLIFLMFSVLSEYVGRVLEEAQQRPLFFVRGERNSSVLLKDESRRNVVEEPDGNVGSTHE